MYVFHIDQFGPYPYAKLTERSEVFVLTSVYIIPQSKEDNTYIAYVSVSLSFARLQPHAFTD